MVESGSGSKPHISEIIKSPDYSKLPTFYDSPQECLVDIMNQIDVLHKSGGYAAFLRVGSRAREEGRDFSGKISITTPFHEEIGKALQDDGWDGVEVVEGVWPAIHCALEFFDRRGVDQQLYISVHPHVLNVSSGIKNIALYPDFEEANGAGAKIDEYFQNLSNE